MTVLFVGGAAGVGKTTTARALARSLDAGWLQLETVWLALADAADPDTRRVLRVDAEIRRAAEAGDTSAADVERLVAQHVAAARSVTGPLLTAIWFEAETHPVLVVDGSWLLPGDLHALRARVDPVAAAYVVESDREAVQAALDSRCAGRPAAVHHRLVGDVVWSYGQWLAREARQRGIPVVQSRPFATQPARVRAALGR